MSPFDRAVQFVLEQEGGYVNNPSDPGGETNFGISKRAYPALDIKNLTKEAAIEIYHQDYWLFCKCDQIPSPIAVTLFDSSVNQGPSAAIKLLQRSLGVKDDGVMGSVTIGATFKTDVRKLTAEFIAQRGFRYATTGDVEVFGLGWFRRLAECHQVSLEPL